MPQREDCNGTKDCKATMTGLQWHKGLQSHNDRTAVSQGQDCKVSAIGSVLTCFQLSVIVFLLSFIYCRCYRFFIMLHYL